LPFPGTIPETFEPAYRTVTAGRFDRFLCQKLANLFVENTQQNPSYSFQPAPFGFLHRSYDRSRSLHYRDYIQSCLDLHQFLWHLLPGTGPYGSVNPKRPEYNKGFMRFVWSSDVSINRRLIALHPMACFLQTIDLPLFDSPIQHGSYIEK